VNIYSPGLSLVCLDFHDLIQLKPYKAPFSLHPSPPFILSVSIFVFFLPLKHLPANTTKREKKKTALPAFFGQ